jgi:hypothetical protein
MEKEVVNNKKESRFEWQEDGHTAVLEYEFEDGAMALVHTGVPHAIEGRGIAAKLAQYALEYAREHQIQVIPYCLYVQAYLKRHPEYKDVVKQRS